MTLKLLILVVSLFRSTFGQRRNWNANMFWCFDCIACENDVYAKFPEGTLTAKPPSEVKFANTERRLVMQTGRWLVRQLAELQNDYPVPSTEGYPQIPFLNGASHSASGQRAPQRTYQTQSPPPPP